MGSFRLLLFPTSTSSLRFWLESSEETFSLVSLVSGKTMIWLAIRHQLVGLLTTSVLRRVSMIFRKIQFMQLFTLSLCLLLQNLDRCFWIKLKRRCKITHGPGAHD